MTFYQECFGGDLTIQTVGESPMAEHLPAALHERVLHAHLTAEGLSLMASDMSTPEQLVRSGMVTLSVTSDDADRVRAIFEKLSVGANVTNTLQEQFFGLYGDLTDRFGFCWMFEVDKAEG
jgi:PhnB protein